MLLPNWPLHPRICVTDHALQRRMAKIIAELAIASLDRYVLNTLHYRGVQRRFLLNEVYSLRRRL